jgi:hypothetical protein
VVAAFATHGLLIVKFLKTAAVLLYISVLAACSSVPGRSDWGADATIRPGWERVRASALNAARDPWVWAPLIGAAAFQIDDWDRRTSDWARERTPVFGSQQSAEDWSDDLRSASAVAHYATMLATPSGDSASEWIENKVKGALVDAAAVSATVVMTKSLKATVDRERPNGLAGESFPSGHTSTSAVHTRLASRNLQSIEMSRAAHGVLDAGLYALTIGTSWARIEAGWHYPSDTLVGMALGNFIASFVNDAFLGTPEQEDAAAMSISLDGESAMLSWAWRF